MTRVSFNVGQVLHWRLELMNQILEKSIDATEKFWYNWKYICVHLNVEILLKEVCNIAMWPASQPFHRSELLKICYKFLLKILGDWKIIYEWWIEWGLGLHITWQWCQKVKNIGGGGETEVIGGDNLPSPVRIGLTDLQNIGGASGSPGPPSFGITAVK